MRRQCLPRCHRSLRPFPPRHPILPTRRWRWGWPHPCRVPMSRTLQKQARCSGPARQWTADANRTTAPVKRNPLRLRVQLAQHRQVHQLRRLGARLRQLSGRQRALRYRAVQPQGIRQWRWILPPRIRGALLTGLPQGPAPRAGLRSSPACSIGLPAGLRGHCLMPRRPAGRDMGHELRRPPR